VVPDFDAPQLPTSGASRGIAWVSGSVGGSPMRGFPFGNGWLPTACPSRECRSEGFERVALDTILCRPA